MNDTSVPSRVDGENVGSADVLTIIADQLAEMTPEIRKAATYVIENPRDVGVSSIREIASAANVKPNTFVRMARQVGFAGYDDFREPFREEIRQGRASFPDRARWLQSLRDGGKLDDLYADMVQSALSNIEATFASVDAVQMQAAAAAIWKSRRTFTLGVGVNHSIAQNFTYVASTGMVEFIAIPRPGSTASDDLAWVDERDVVIAITCKPFRTEVVEAAHIAKEQGATLIAISDSPASPIILAADYGFIVSIDTPQFFPSSIATIGLLETLLSFVVATSSSKVVKRVERFHARRHELGLYLQNGEDE
ncbi:MAG: MurR/RpiR family transcriptional regulator [Pseudomonadota bacterium]